MKFLFEEPTLFWRDCYECQRYLLDKDNQPHRNRDGVPTPNPAPPVCREMACWDRKRDCKRPRFGPYDAALYRRWQLCRQYRCLPLPGGLAGQNPWDMERFRILDCFQNAQERGDSTSLLAAMFAPR